ncbi:MAG: T9SS type A sorting domain-containing protein [Bacteroidales bacterium]|nr:T9SS type A sorting domain-containing protein [Bacteroidales bacterium]
MKIFMLSAYSIISLSYSHTYGCKTFDAAKRFDTDPEKTALKNMSIDSRHYFGNEYPPASFTNIMSSRTIFVDSANTSGIEDGSELNPYNTIQEAIDGSIDGDTILISPGTYPPFALVNFEGKLIIASHFINTGDSSYINNTIIDGNQNGSVVYISNCTNSIIINGLTIRNGNAITGGGIHCQGTAIDISNVVFINNTATDAGGAIIANQSSLNLKSIHALFNTANGGGAICLDNSTFELSNSNIFYNIASYGGGGLYLNNSNGRIEETIISGNTSSYAGGGVYGQSSFVSFVKTSFVDNSTDGYGGGAYLNVCSGALNNIIVANNSSDDIGGGLFLAGYPNLILTSSKIVNNYSPNGASGLEGYMCNLHVNNCLFAKNYGSVCIEYVETTQRQILNSTIVNNPHGSIRIDKFSNIEIKNTIDWGNNKIRSGTFSDVQFSLFEGGIAGGSNIDADPKFVDTLTGDYRLLYGSPCIDAGTYDTNTIYMLKYDLLGNPRYYNDRIDIGAIESIIPNVVNRQFCSNDNKSFLTLNSPKIRWYNTESMDSLISEEDTLFVDISNLNPGYHTYYVTHFVGDNESLPSPITIDLRQAPKKPTVVQKGQNLLICPDSGSYTYYWYFNGIPMPGENKQFLNFNPSYSGYYQVGLASNYCLSKSDLFAPKIQQKTAPVNLSITIFPNPANEILNVIINNEPADKIILHIHDLSGVLVYNALFEKESGYVHKEIDLKDLPKGIYVITIKLNNESHNKTFILR